MITNNPTNSASYAQCSIAHAVPLADKNWFQTGGPARLFCEPQTVNEFKTVIMFAQEQAIPIFVLGNGANIVISDEGFNGLVIRPALKSIHTTASDNETILVTAEAGASMQELIIYCLNNNILGLEEFSGIPGTVGGSVFINLHYYEFFLSHFLHSATVIEKSNATIKSVDTSWFSFDYNTSRLLRRDFFLLNATFKLKKASELQTAHAWGRRVEIIRHRIKRYPSTHTCGSFFRNFFPHEVAPEDGRLGIIHCAYYLDRAGVRGLAHCGKALVSHQHANMIVAQPGSTTTDIITLARSMQQTVFDMFGIIPQPECQLIGFSEYPLL